MICGEGILPIPSSRDRPRARTCQGQGEVCKVNVNEDFSVKPRTIGLCLWFVLNESSTQRRALGREAQGLVAERRVSADGLRLSAALKF